MTPLYQQPAYAAAKADIDRLCDARTKIETRLREIDMLVGQQSLEDRPSQHVAAALVFAETGSAVRVGDGITSLNDERQALVPQREALDAAIKRRREDLDSIARQLSVEVCATLVADHRGLAAKMLAALEALDAAQQAEADMFRTIESNGYDPRFTQHVAWPAVGRLTDSSGSLAWNRARELRNYVR